MKPSSLSFLEKAVNATVPDSEETFRGDSLALIGVAYQNDMSTTELLASTSLANVIFQGKDMTATVTLKVAPNQVKELQTIQETQNLVGGGAFLDGFKVKEPLMSSPFANDMLLPNTAYSNIQDYRLELHLEDAIVEFSETKVMGETIYQFTVEDVRESTLGTFKQGIVLLFRKRTYDDENLFSTMLVKNKDGAPQPKLNKRDTTNMIHLLMTPNPTGLIIGSVLFMPKHQSVTSVIYPMHSEVLIGISNEKFHWIADTGLIEVVQEDIKYSTVKKIGENYYLYSIYTVDGVIRISLG